MKLNYNGQRYDAVYSVRTVLAIFVSEKSTSSSATSALPFSTSAQHCLMNRQAPTCKPHRGCTLLGSVPSETKGNLARVGSADNMTICYPERRCTQRSGLPHTAEGSHTGAWGNGGMIIIRGQSAEVSLHRPQIRLEVSVRFCSM